MTRHATLLVVLLAACDPASVPDAGSGPDASLAEVSCASYCQRMEEVCPEDTLHPREACEHVCAHPDVPLFDALGSAADASGNTLGCRVHHLALAVGATGPERAVHCAAANLSGGGVCGGLCDNYCLASTGACTRANPAYAGPDVHASLDDCRSACAALSTDVLEGIAQPEQLFGYGDTAQCRLHHTHAAMEMDAFDLHCPHASPGSTRDTCDDAARPNLPNYCAFATAFCPGLFPAGTEVGDCIRMVGAEVMRGRYVDEPFESFTDTSGNTLGCLNHWIVQTAWDESRCALADWRPGEWESAGGAGVCDP